MDLLPNDAVWYVYILTNRGRTVLYIGVTNSLTARLARHRARENATAFTYRYTLNRLVYYECFDSPDAAIAREKVLKGWRRERKDALVSEKNPKWIDLSGSVLGMDAPEDRPVR